MVSPTVRSLRGQAVVYGFSEPLIDARWKQWIISLLSAKLARLHEETFESHDILTEGSQVHWMSLAVAAGMVLRKRNINFGKVIRVAGAPAVLQSFGMLRTLDQPEVASEILVSHKSAASVARDFAQAFYSLAEMIENKEREQIKREMLETSDLFSAEERSKIQFMTDWLVRMLGDLRGGAFCFKVDKEHDRLGLGADLLACFDEVGLNKTTTAMQTLPDGSVIFFIGLQEPENTAVEQALTKVFSQLDVEEIKGGFWL